MTEKKKRKNNINHLGLAKVGLNSRVVLFLSDLNSGILLYLFRETVKNILKYILFMHSCR